MNNIIVSSIPTEIPNLFLTKAGELALLTPCPRREIVSNNRRDRNGRDYLTASLHEDDLNVSVQFVAFPSRNRPIKTIVEELVAKCKGGKVCGYDVLYKSVASITESNKAIYMSANLIKLAK